MVITKELNVNKAYIKHIAYYLPQRIVSNEELIEEFPEWSVDKIVEKVGVRQRHIAAVDETAADMAVMAAERLFSDNNYDRGRVDFVLLCTQSPDYKLPTSACVIQHRLGLRTDIGALDFNLGCSGYVYGLSLAKGLIAGGIAKNVLLLTAETYNKYIHPKDKGNRSIFGDGASATIVSNEGMAEIGQLCLGTDGLGAENLMIRTGEARHPNSAGDVSFDDKGNPKSSDYLYMNGSEIFSFTLTHVPKLVKQTLLLNNLTMDDIGLHVFHQANLFMLEFLRKKLKIAPERFYTNLSRVGNTVSSSIPIALCDAMSEGVLSKSQNVLVAGFGVGYSWGGTVLSF